MKIAICDDSAREVNDLHDIITANTDKQTQVDTFVSSTAMLSAIQNGARYDAAFLDIDMPEISGMELGRLIKLHVPKTMVVFVTRYPQYAVDAFDCEAFHYLLKPVDPIKAAQVLDRLMRRYLENNRFHIIKIRRETVRVPIRDIYYIECCQKHVIYHTENTDYETVGKLKTVYGELRRYGFLQIHQGYLVNMDKISHFDGFDIILSDGRRVPMSVRKRAEVLSAYAGYIEVH